MFLVEGNKTVSELFASPYSVKEIFTINNGLSVPEHIPVSIISETELKKISFLQHPKDTVAVCALPPSTEFLDTSFNLVLDGVQDPGNLGTIIRLADWFGLEQIICSEDTVDLYNPKVVQASMGSFARVNVHYTDLPQFLASSPHTNIGTDMDGENLYEFKFPERLNLIFGNEGNGLRPTTEEVVRHRITIPRFGKSKATESLNVSMAAGIILGQYFSK